MKHLLEISKIVTKKKVKKIEIFENLSLQQKNSKFNEFYEMLVSGKLSSDKDAAKLLYDSIPTDDKYRQLKSRFKKRLLNTLFFVDVNLPATSNYDRAYYTCNKEWALVRILKSNDAEHTAAHLARHILSIALKFQFAEVIVNTATLLSAYSVKTDDEKMFEKYLEYNKVYRKVMDREAEAEEIMQRIYLNYGKPSAKLEKWEEQLKLYCERLNELNKEQDSPIIQLNRIIANIHYWEYLQDYEKVVAFCEEAEKLLEPSSLWYRKDKYEEIAEKKMLALLYLRDNKKAAESMQVFEPILEKGSIWLTLMEYQICVSLHAKVYNEAFELFDKVHDSLLFKKLKSEELERWNVLETYLFYLRLIEFEPNESKPKRYKRFRLKRFLDEPILYPKNKRIYTVTMVCAQVLFLVEEYRYGEAFERVERLKSYVNQQLKKDDHFRTIQFVRLVQQLAKAHFNFTNIGVYKKYLERIQQTIPNFKTDKDNLELVPYEDLWNTLLDRVGKQLQFQEM